MRPRFLPLTLRTLWTDVLLIIGLGVVGWLLFGWLLHESLFIYGDNPGQFARLWFGIHYGIQGWVAEWYAGYPELQFYPPGFVLIGTILATLSPSTLESDYNTLLFGIALLPVFSCYGFCRYVLRTTTPLAGQVAGGTTALLVLVFPIQWGGVHAIPIGLVGERLAFGLVPFVLWSGWSLIEAPRLWKIALSAALLALLALTHPFHAPAPVLALCIYCLICRAPRQAWLALGGVGIATFGLMAWWLIPLLQYREFAAPLVRATLPETMAWLVADPVPFLWVAALLAVAGNMLNRTKAVPTVLTLAVLVLLLPLGIWLNHTILMEQFQVYLFDPIRFIAEYYLVLILLTGFAVALPFASPNGISLRVTWTISAFAMVFLCLSLQNSYTQITDTPQNRTTYFYEYWKTDPAFAGLWEILGQSEGRILYTSHYLTLQPTNSRPIPTALKSLTAYFTGRDQIGGTFSHWSPVARLLWQGDPMATRLPERVESQDDQLFLGIPWSALSDERLQQVTQAFNISTIVTTAKDINARTFLDRSSGWQSYWNNDYFFLYRPTHLHGKWVTVQNGSAVVISRTATRWAIQVPGDTDAPLTLSLAYFPTWQATSNSKNLPMRQNEYGLTIIERGHATDITVQWHAPQNAHGVTWLVVVCLGVGCIGEFVRTRRKKV